MGTENRRIKIHEWEADQVHEKEAKVEDVANSKIIKDLTGEYI